jgi:hypothetical protein
VVLQQAVAHLQIIGTATIKQAARMLVLSGALALVDQLATVQAQHPLVRLIYAINLIHGTARLKLNAKQ